MTEGTLSLDAIKSCFNAVAVMDTSGRGGVNFEGFCVLMEQLEAAWQANAVTMVDSLSIPHVQAPTQTGIAERGDNSTEIPTESGCVQKQKVVPPPSSPIITKTGASPLSPSGQETDNNLKMTLPTTKQRQLLEQLASHKQAFVCEAARIKVAQAAAQEGLERISRQQQEASQAKDATVFQNRLDVAKAVAETSILRQKQLATESQELFARLWDKKARAEEQKTHEEQALSRKKMSEFEDHRVEVLWKVLVDCQMHFFTPQECHKLSRLYLHLRRATTV